MDKALFLALQQVPTYYPLDNSQQLEIRSVGTPFLVSSHPMAAQTTRAIAGAKGAAHQITGGLLLVRLLAPGDLPRRHYLPKHQ